MAFWLFLGELSKVEVLLHNGGGNATQKSGNDIQISQLRVLGQLKEV